MNTIITIARQFGSGGREIGHRIAEILGVKCYDRDLITLAAEKKRTERGSTASRR